MVFASIITMPKAALVAPLDFIERKTQILTRQIKLPTLKNTTRRAAALNVKAFKGVFPAPDVLEHAANGVTPSLARRPDNIQRKDFPQDFYFGCSTSALQTEGTGTEGGRGPSTWDAFIRDENGEERPAVDSYNLYMEDVHALKKMGATAYRFSIGWPRILPDGTVKGGINEEGIDFYNKFIDALIAEGITPFVTLTHFDLPQTLQDKYHGFLSKDIVNDFRDYADICFEHFGDRVKHWTTINEPQVFGQYGYRVGLPSDYDHKPTDPFIASHHILLSHAAAVQVYREKHQEDQGGEIGLSLVTQWFEPHDDTRHDKDASERAFDFLYGWFMEPMIHGHYPFIMKALVRDGLPDFTPEEKDMVKGSFDFIGINYYTSRYASHVPFDPEHEYPTSEHYQHAELTADRNGEYIGELAPGSDAIYVYPKGLKDALIYIKNHYNNPKIFITENGYPEKRDDSLPLNEALFDNGRIQHMQGHLRAIKDAIDEGVDVNGYFMWALMDCMEMGSYYNVRFGLFHTDYLNGFTRIPKKSAEWMYSFMDNGEGK